VDLQSGKVALGVLQQRMRPGESVEVKTHNAVAAVRGTVIVVEIVRASAQAGEGSTALTTNVHVLHGTAVVTPLNVPGALPITVGQFQTYSQIGNVIGSIRQLTPAAVNQILSNLHAAPQLSQSSSGVADQITTQQQTQVTSAFGGPGATGTPVDLGSFLPGGNGAPQNSNVQQNAPITPPIGQAPPPPPPPPPPKCSSTNCRKH